VLRASNIEVKKPTKESFVISLNEKEFPTAILVDGPDLWIGTSTVSVYYYDLRNGDLLYTVRASSDPNGCSDKPSLM